MKFQVKKKKRPLVPGFKSLDKQATFWEVVSVFSNQLGFDGLNPSDTVRMSPGLDIHSLLGSDGTLSHVDQENESQRGKETHLKSHSKLEPGELQMALRVPFGLSYFPQVSGEKTLQWGAVVTLLTPTPGWVVRRSIEQWGVGVAPYVVSAGYHILLIQASWEALILSRKLPMVQYTEGLRPWLLIPDQILT